ncbi:MAG: hypothetical protein Q8O61_00340 [Nocardioides sp.]|nr:hypothetical protein [Nocardioides sp.]
MLRTAILGTLSLLLGLTLGLGALGSSSTGAAPAALTGAAASTGTAKTGEGAARFKPWGRTRAPDQVLRKGCRLYKYHYAVKPPSADWTAEVFLIEPGGNTLAHAVYSPDSDPAVGNRHWRICRPTTTPGRFRMRMKIVWYDNFDGHVGWVRPSYFRLTRPKR